MKNILLILLFSLSLQGCIIYEANYTQIPSKEIIRENNIQKRFENCVYNIEVKVKLKFIDGTTRDSSLLGSGFVIDKYKNNYYVLTARHVVHYETIFTSAKVKKILFDGNEAEILAKHNTLDVAVLKFKSKKNYKITKIAMQAEVGQMVFAAGYADGNKNKLFIIPGYICNISDKRIYYNGGGMKGISGGPLLNQNGEAIAINNEFFVSKYTAYRQFVGCLPCSKIDKFLAKTIGLDKISDKLSEIFKLKKTDNFIFDK